jgi:integrase
VVVTMRVICGCGHAADETYEFDMPADKAVAREAYEPRTCPPSSMTSCSVGPRSLPTAFTPSWCRCSRGRSPRTWCQPPQWSASSAPGGDERPRDRVLTAEEVRGFWTKLDTADMAEPTRLALKLLLVTAQRRGELTFAKWSHFNVDDKLWTIPVELLKSSHARRSTPEPHQVPLSPLALDLLGKLKALSGSSPFVLPARADKRKKRSYSARVLSRAVRENAKHFGIKHFTPHDLRRTAASFMTKLKVPRLHVEKVLNHSTRDIAEVYDRHDYLAEKRAALERWAEHLQTVIAGKDQSVIAMMVRRG